MDKVTFDGIEISLSGTKRTYLLSGELGLIDKEAGDPVRIVGLEEVDAVIETARGPLEQALAVGAEPETGKEAGKEAGKESALEEAAEEILIRFPVFRSARLDLNTVCGAQAGPDGWAVKCGLSILREWHTAYIGMGSNLGDREANIERALELIDISRHSRVDEVSPLYETEPVGYLDQGKFLNGVVRAETLLGPRGLVRFLLEVESFLLRERTVPNGPRTLDLDVLFYDDQITSFEEAVIPHPRLHSRMFVLKPLTDLAPYLMHPVLGERCYRLKEMLVPEQPEPPVWGGAGET